MVGELGEERWGEKGMSPGVSVKYKCVIKKNAYKGVFWEK